MALVILTEIPGLTREQYIHVVTKVNEAGVPDGAIFHAGGPVEGGYRFVEVWESPEAVEAFYGSDLLKEAAAGTPPGKVLMTWPVFGMDTGSGWKQTA